MSTSIYHNPRCSKSRLALALLAKQTPHYTVIDYLKNPLSELELKDLLKKLGMPAEALLRKNEDIYKKAIKGKYLTEDQIIQAMHAFPKLIERPIVVNGNNAVIGRPAEKILELF